MGLRVNGYIDSNLCLDGRGGTPTNKKRNRELQICLVLKLWDL